MFLEVELDSRPEPIEISITVEYSVQNDGIGPYEFWGQRCVDKGRAYIVIEDHSWNQAGFSEDDVYEVERQITKRQSQWEESLSE